MYTYSSMQALMPSLGTTEKRDVFGTTPTQYHVKDEVVFAPAQNPYAALLKAAERLHLGGNVFSDKLENSSEDILKHV